MFHIGSLGRSHAIDLNEELLSTAAQGCENECAFLTLKQKLFALLEENGGSILLLATTRGLGREDRISKIYRYEYKTAVIS